MVKVDGGWRKGIERVQGFWWREDTFSEHLSVAVWKERIHSNGSCRDCRSSVSEVAIVLEMICLQSHSLL